MANYVFLLPREQMAEQVRAVIQKFNRSDIDVKVIQTENTLGEAHEAVQNGTDVIIARGIQANLIKQHTNYTVIEIAATGQEMGLLVTHAKELVAKDEPVIAVVGIKNMFCDMEHFNYLFKVNIKTYFVESREEIAATVEKAYEEGADIIIGGDIANKQAEKLGLPYLFVDALGEEAIRSALDIASRVGWAIDLERKHTAQLQTLLDYSFNGIIKIDRDGNVEVLNSIAEDMLNIESDMAKGKPIISLIKQFDQKILDDVLSEGREYYAAYMQINNKAYAVSLAPIQLTNDAIDGSIISFSEVESLVNIEKKIRSEIYFKNRESSLQFEELEQRSVSMINILKNAKLYARTTAPILLTGPPGSEKELLPRCIHNESPQKGNLYAEVNCSAYSGKAQYKYLFDNLDGSEENGKGIISLLHEGTLVLNNIESLNMQCQAYLFYLLSEKAVMQKSTGRFMPIHFRLIATTEHSIQQLVKEGVFHAELYYILNTLSLLIPPLSKREDDIDKWLDYYIKSYCKKYSRYISITNDAKKELCKFDWDGNLIQLKSFCERIVISSPRRTVNQSYIQTLLLEAYPILRNMESGGKTEVFENLEAAEIATLLETYSGNRTAVAEKLGISTTTLWRRMKRLNIRSNFTK